MDGNRITIYEGSNICGGCLDGIKDPKEGYLFRGEREMEDHYECLWDLMRSIPSLDVEDASVLDDFYRLNKDHPNYSKCRTTHNRGQAFPTDGKMLLTSKAQGELMKLFFTRRRGALRQEVRANSWARSSSAATSGCIGCRCSPSGPGTARWR